MAGLRRARDAWNRYWFRPAPAIDLDVLRIAAVGFQLVLLWGADWWWGPMPAHLARTAALPDFFYNPIGVLFVYSELGGPRPTLGPVLAIYGLTWVAGVLALIGWFTRPAMAVFAAGSVLIVTFYYSFTDFHHVESLLLITLLLLAWAPVGRTLSVDALRARLRHNIGERRFEPWDQAGVTDLYAAWPVHLVRVLFALVYLSACVTKLNLDGGGLFRWANGSTLQYWMIQDSYFFSSQVALWFSQLPLPVLAVASWGALAFEGTFWTAAVWPRLAAFYVPAGVAFHLGIFATQRAAFFPYYALYACFLPARRLLLAARERITADRPLVLYDAACLLCLRSMTILQFLDWFDRIAYVPLQQDPLPRLGRVDAAFRHRALEQMHVVERDGSLHAGFAACRRLAWRLPLAWPIVPFLYLPGATMIGSFAYRRVAETRERFETCDGDACMLHRRR